MPFSYPELYLFFVHVDKLLYLISWFYLEKYCNNVFNSTLHNLALFVCRHFILTALYTAVFLFSDPVRPTCNNVLSAPSMSRCAFILLTFRYCYTWELHCILSGSQPVPHYYLIK
jgi:hypothetical protein